MVILHKVITLLQSYMKQTFIKNLIFLIFLNVLIKPFWLLEIDRRVQNTVGPEDYGLYFALFNFSYLFQMILDMGISNFNNRSIARHSQFLTKFYPNIIIIKLFLTLIYIVITFSIAFMWGYSAWQLKLLVVLAFNQILMNFILFNRSNLAGLHFFRLDSIFSVLDKLLMIIICGYLLLKYDQPGEFQIIWFIYAQTISLAIAVLVSFIVVISRTTNIKFKWSYPYLLVLLKKTFPFALLSVLMTLYMRVDGVMIERLLPVEGARQTGIYASAYRLLDACSMFSYMFATLLLPIFSRMIVKKESVKPILTFSFKALLVPAVIFSITASFFSKEIMDRLYFIGPEEEYYQVFEILIYGFIPLAIHYTFGTLLTANDNMKFLNVLAGVGFALNVVLNFFLIQTYQAYGAAIATLITLSLIGIAQLIFVKKVFKLGLHLKSVFLFVALIIVSIVSNLTFKNLFDNWLFNFGTVLFMLFTVAIIFKMIDYKSILELLKARNNPA